MLSAVDASFLNSVRPDIVTFFRNNGWDTAQEKWPQIYDHWFNSTMNATDYPKNAFPSVDAFVAAVRAGTAQPNRAGGNVGTVPGATTTTPRAGGTTTVPRVGGTGSSQLDDMVNYLKKNPVNAAIFGIVAFVVLNKVMGTSGSFKS